MYFKDLLGLKTCDPQINGDIRRLIRIPGTVHCGKFKRIKGKGWVRIGEGSYCETISHSEGNKLNLNEIDTPEYPEYEFEESNTNGNGNKQNRYYPCIDKLMDDKEPSQLIRYSYVAYKLLNGQSPEQILSDIEERHSEGKVFEWDDWDLNYTSYQIFHIASDGKYQPMSCNTIKKLGYCDNSCKMSYEEIKKWLKRKDENVRTKAYELGQNV
jgi:hypothetical protein